MMKDQSSRKPWPVVLGAALALTAASALAGEMTLYEHRDFGGASVTVHGAAPNLQRTGFNDTASSIIVRDGIWEACTDAHYNGQCVQLQPGDYPGLAARLNNRVSSVREIAFVRGEPAPVVVGAGEMPRIVLYEHTGFGGRSVELTSTIRDLDRINFQDRADAAVVYGGVWRLCVGERGRGECHDFAPGRYDSLGSLAGRVSSAELIATGSAGVVSQVPGRNARVVLYEFPNFGGREFAIDRDESLPNFEWMGFNDRAASMRVESGYWTFCSDSRFRGDCRTFGPGDYARLPWQLDRKISSARPTNEVYGGTLNPYTYVR